MIDPPGELGVSVCRACRVGQCTPTPEYSGRSREVHRWSARPPGSRRRRRGAPAAPACGACRAQPPRTACLSRASRTILFIYGKNKKQADRQSTTTYRDIGSPSLPSRSPSPPPTRARRELAAPAADATKRCGAGRPGLTRLSSSLSSAALSALQRLISTPPLAGPRRERRTGVTIKPAPSSVSVEFHARAPGQGLASGSGSGSGPGLGPG